MDSCPALNCQSAAWVKLNGVRLLLWAAALAGAPAYGLEVGTAQMLSGLGQPLSLHLPIRWAPGEARSAGCLKVSVEAGERQLSAAELQQSLLKGADANSALIWVRSKGEMVEPVLMLTLGCPAQQVMALVDPVHSMMAPAGGSKAMPAELAPLDLFGTPSDERRPVRALKVRAERATPGNQLRLSVDSLPPLSMADAETPGLRWRFDSDIDGAGTVAHAPRKTKAGKDQGFYVRPGAPGASLLMSIDVGRPAGPADLLMAQDGPERLARAQAQFSALQADHRALKLELDKLAAAVAARDAAVASTQYWLMAVAAGLAIVAAGAVYLFRRRAHGHREFQA